MTWYLVEVEEITRHQFRIEAESVREAQHVAAEVVDPDDSLDSELYSWVVESVVREDEI